MKFTAKTEDEIQKAMLWPKGEYTFEVLKAENAKSGPQSKNPGTDYIKLLLRLFDDGGGERFQNAILHPAMDAQLRHFCVETNQLDKYESGTLQPEDCEGKSGTLRLKVKDAEGNYPAKNEVADYGPAKKKAKQEPEAQPDAPPDDVPFN